MNKEIRSSGKAIRAKCLDCSAGSTEEVRNSPVKDCPLYPFRRGRNPFRTPRILTDEQKAAASERFKLARSKKPVSTSPTPRPDNEI
jgi:hypothetical protein